MTGTQNRSPDFLERAWAALMQGDGATASDEMRHNEIARIRPLQSIAAWFTAMGRDWASAWLDLPNGGLAGRPPREVMAPGDPAGWDEVAAVFRRKTVRFDGHLVSLRAERWAQVMRRRRTEDEAMTKEADGTKPRRNNADLYRLFDPDVTAQVLGARCTDARQALGLSTAEAALRCGIAEEQLTRFEANGGVDLQTALQIIRGLSMSTGFADAFRLPRFTSLDDMREYAARSPAG